MNTLPQQSTIQIRLDDATKSAASDLFNKLGLDMSTAVKMFLKKAVDVKAIPFIPSLTVNGFTPAYEEMLIREGQQAIKNGKIYDSASEMFEDILGKDYKTYV